MSKVKQVIVIRKDLKMRRGKEIAQGSHASMAFFTNRLKETYSNFFRIELSGLFSYEEIEWIKGSFAKVCLQVDSEQELLDVYQKAKDAGLTVHLITDAGLTEFGGIPTNTCICIGPHEEDKFIGISDALKLY